MACFSTWADTEGDVDEVANSCLPRVHGSLHEDMKVENDMFTEMSYNEDTEPDKALTGVVYHAISTDSEGDVDEVANSRLPVARVDGSPREGRKVENVTLTQVKAREDTKLEDTKLTSPQHSRPLYFSASDAQAIIAATRS